MLSFLARTALGLLLSAAVTIAILVGVYLLLVKPALDSADDKLSEALQATGLGDEIERALDEAGLGDVNLDEVGSKAEARRLAACVRRAHTDAQALRACTDRFAN